MPQIIGVCKIPAAQVTVIAGSLNIAWFLDIKTGNTVSSGVASPVTDTSVDPRPFAVDMSAFQHWEVLVWSPSTGVAGAGNIQLYDLWPSYGLTLGPTGNTSLVPGGQGTVPYAMSNINVAAIVAATITQVRTRFSDSSPVGGAAPWFERRGLCCFGITLTAAPTTAQDIYVAVWGHRDGAV